MKKRLIAIAAMTLLALVPTSASAITDGFADVDNEYPFVGLLAFRDADGAYMLAAPARCWRRRSC